MPSLLTEETMMVVGFPLYQSFPKERAMKN